MPEIRNWQWTKDFSDANAPAPLAKGIRRKPCSLIARLQSAEIKAEVAVA